jgi:hypothetical protein
MWNILNLKSKLAGIRTKNVILNDTVSTKNNSWHEGFQVAVLRQESDSHLYTAGP